MTSHGSPYARFQRALRIGRLSMVRAAAAELPRIDLDDALAICLLIERQDGERYERAVVRWLARLAMEVPAVGIDDLREGLVAFEALPYNPVAAAELPRIDLDDALAICLLIERQDGERYERAVVRWLARLATEVPAVGIDDLREGLVAFEALPYNPVAAAETLAALCERHGLRRAAERLRRPR